MLQPIDNSNFADALHLLLRGFGRTQAWWCRGFERARSFASPDTGWPLGYILHRHGRSVGVLLTFASHRGAFAGKAPDIVNLSSWYVDPDSRGAGPFMLSQLIRGRDHTFTNLTPGRDVIRICRSLKFTEWNEGVLLASWPQMLARQRQQSRVVQLSKIPSGVLDEPTLVLLEDHERLGCMATALWDGARWHPLIFLSGSLFRVPCGYLIYAQSRREILPHLRTITAFLLSRGLPLLILDADAAECPPGTVFMPKRRKIFRGTMPHDCIDYAYSEVVYFNLW